MYSFQRSHHICLLPVTGKRQIEVISIQTTKIFKKYDFQAKWTRLEIHWCNQKLAVMVG